MKRKWVAVCLAGVLAVAALTGCSESKADKAASSAAEETEEAAEEEAAEETEEAAEEEAAEETEEASEEEAAEETEEAVEEEAEEAAEETEEAAGEEAEAAAGINYIPETDKDYTPDGDIDFSTLKIGEIEDYIVTDGGWDQANHQSILAAMAELGIPEENLIVLEEIGEEQAAVQTAAEELINEGCTLIIGASTGHAPFLSEIAADYPDVTFAQWGNKRDNLVGYEIRSYEGMFLAGYACELLSQEENTELGFSASFNEFSVRTAINAYALGAKYANPEATVRVAGADSWYDIDKETQCAQSLIDAGIKYMGMEASSPAIPETCEKNGAFVVGYHNDMSALAPEAVLVSHTWNFAPIFKNIMIRVAEGTATSDDFYYWGGECSKLTDFADFVPEDVVAAVEELKGQIEAGDVQIFAGELKDNAGNVLVEDGEVMADEDIILQNFYVEGVSTSWTAGE